VKDLHVGPAEKQRGFLMESSIATKAQRQQAAQRFGESLCLSVFAANEVKTK
jgi:hypothetical protein